MVIKIYNSCNIHYPCRVDRNWGNYMCSAPHWGSLGCSLLGPTRNNEREIIGKTYSKSKETGKKKSSHKEHCWCKPMKETLFQSIVPNTLTKISCSILHLWIHLQDRNFHPQMCDKSFLDKFNSLRTIHFAYKLFCYRNNRACNISKKLYAG